MELILMIVVIVLCVGMLVMLKNNQRVRDQELSELKAELKELRANETNRQILSNVENLDKTIKVSIAETEIIKELRQDLNKLNIDSQLQQQNGEAILAEMSEINEIMNNKKLRGNYGEYQLASVLEEYFGSGRQHQMQYKCNGGIVDCAVFVGEKFIPIDAKFPLEGFKKLQEDPENAELIKQFKNDMKAHVKKVKQYVDGGTVGYGLIYLPSLAVYQEVFNYPELVRTAMENHIYFTNINNLIPIVHTIISLYQDNQREQEIAKTLKEMDLLSSKIESLVNAYESYQTTRNTLTKKEEKLERAVRGVQSKYEKVRQIDYQVEDK